jgi:hypothetical protein
MAAHVAPDALGHDVDGVDDVALVRKRDQIPLPVQVFVILNMNLKTVLRLPYL